jgi:hypothetical protein
MPSGRINKGADVYCFWVLRELVLTTVPETFVRMQGCPLTIWPELRSLFQGLAIRVDTHMVYIANGCECFF